MIRPLVMRNGEAGSVERRRPIPALLAQRTKELRYVRLQAIANRIMRLASAGLPGVTLRTVPRRRERQEKHGIDSGYG